MQAGHRHPYLSVAGWLLLALAAPLLWWIAHPAWQIVVEPTLFLFVHSVVELFAVVAAMLVFATGYRAILSLREGAVVLLGIAFLGVGLLDFLHTLSYVGMPDAISANSPHKSIFFWLAARLLAALALLVYAWMPATAEPSSSQKHWALVAVLALVGTLAYIGLVRPDAVPALFIPGKGLTPLKIGLEWLVIAFNLATLAVLWQRRVKLARECLAALAFAVALSAVSELFFTMLGVIDKDGANVLGHAYKVAAYLYLLHATFNEALRRPLELLEAQHQRESRVLSAAPDGVLWVDQSGTILMANPAMETLSAYPIAELLGHNVDIFLPEHLRAKHAHSMRAYFNAPQARVMGAMDLKLLRRDGQMLPIDISLGHWEDGEQVHAIAFVRDLTERKKFEASLEHKATHDELTGLPNRGVFRLQLDQALAQAKRGERQVAVLFMDLDDFKTANDSYGHSAGDELLRQVSQRLRSVLRESDILARLGGDEFAFLISDMDSVDEAASVAEKLLLSLETPCCVHDQNIDVGASIGLAFYPLDAQDSDSLLRFADLAMYQAKRSGRGTYACYSAQLDQHAHENLQLHIRLKDAISQGKLRLFYQPQVDVINGAIVGAEALLRWHDEVLGDVSPARFIPVAESTGLILPLSDWVLETACRQIAAWQLAGTPLRVAVNFSAQQFRLRKLADDVSDALRRTGAAAHLLDIEITESVAMAQPVEAREHLDALVSMGCSVSLDDFGTGYSSLAYLKALPVGKLKIDRGFIKDLPHDLSDAKIARSIVALAHSLGLTVVAEGVETDEQLEFLRELGCETYQGWLFAKALEADDLGARLTRTVSSTP